MKKIHVGFLWLLAIGVLAIFALICSLPSTTYSYTAIAPVIPKIINPVPQQLLNIAQCESQNQQFNADGSVLRGKINHDDIGRWQLNTKYWLAQAEALGFDIFTESGNESMALWIYNKYGSQPWSWSSGCWAKINS